MPAEIIQLGEASKVKELQAQLDAKQKQLDELQRQFDEFRNSVFLLVSGSELLKLQINEIMSFLQNNIKDYQNTLQNLQSIKNKIPTILSDK